MAKRIMLIIAAAVSNIGPLAAKPLPVPLAIYTDPAPDKMHPARMEVLHVPSGGVEINAAAYLPAGKGTHPTIVICHGWPGNEKNLDLAQAVRRAGWNAITFNYRGSWGSPGSFRFAHNPEDAQAVIAYLRNPANAAKLGVDPSKIAIIGHSMGGWVSATVGARDPRLLGAGLISAGNMGILKMLPREELIKESAGNAETLADTSPERMADELIAAPTWFDFRSGAASLKNKPVLALTSDDGLAGHTDDLVKAIHAIGGTKVTAYHAPTDHSWSDRRIDLQVHVIRWLNTLIPPRK
ncbi:alpha/beta fold hydrolase [Novosphingobium sp.]|uniref:alpha/beta hydrolase family protein n=1 Tax=Novosphingobium sp. TaxID=1874826 RepID=UPI0025ED8CB9|nr:alpha/beta fold hydrolase [Novosphingobium sp.]